MENKVFFFFVRRNIKTQGIHHRETRIPYSSVPFHFGQTQKQPLLFTAHIFPTCPPHPSLSLPLLDTEPEPPVSLPVAARQYAVFGKVTHGDDVLRRLEKLETKQEGIFVMVRRRGFLRGLGA